MPAHLAPPSNEQRTDDRPVGVGTPSARPGAKAGAFVVRRVTGPLWRWKLLPPAPMRTGIALTKMGAKAAAAEALEAAEREMDLVPARDPDDPDDLPR